MTLTKTLKEVEARLSNVSSGIATLFERLHDEEPAIIEQALKDRGVPEAHRAHGKAEIEELLETQIYGRLDEAKKLAERFLAVTRKITDISKKVEVWERFKADVKKLVFESDWYKKRFPADYERRRRMRETPWAQETYRRWLPGREPSEEYWYENRPGAYRGYSADSRQSIKTASLEDIRKQVVGLTEEVYDLVKEYFGAEGPIVSAADNIRDYLIKLRRPGLLDKLTSIPKVGELLGLISGKKEKQEAISEIIRIIETIFGYEGRPGQYVTLGEKAFLMPTLLELQGAATGLDRVTTEGLEYPSRIVKELEEAELGSAASAQQFSRRLGFQRRRALRSWLLRRLVLSQNKEDFNG